MTDAAPGASATTDAPLPTDPAAAATMRADLMRDPEYAKAALSDEGKRTTLGYLRWVAAGNDPARWGKPPEGIGDVYAQDVDRGVQFAMAHGDVLDQHFDLGQEEQHEILFQRPILQWEKDQAAKEYAKLRRDEAFMERWRRGDRVARSQIYRLSATKGAPLARSLEEVEAWKAANPFTPWDHP